MKDLHFKRALGFSLLLYLCTAIIFAVLSPIFGVSVDTTPQDMPLGQCLVYWVLSIPLTLVLAKWYFRKFQPSFRRGLVLGIFALIISFLLDFIMIAISMPAGTSTDMLVSIYTNWKLLVTILLMVGTTAYAGFEFDRTYTFDEAGLHKKK